MYYLTRDTIGIKYSTYTNEIEHQEYLKDTIIDGNNKYILTKKPHESLSISHDQKTVTITDRSYVFLDTSDYFFLFFLEECVTELHLQQ